MEDLLHLYSGGTGISLDHVSNIDMGEDTASDVIVEEDWATLFALAQSIECDGGTGGSWKPDTFTRPLQAISDLAQSTSSIMSSAPHGRQAKGPILGIFNSEKGSLALKHPILSSSTASVSFPMIIVRTSLAKVTVDNGSLFVRWPIKASCPIDSDIYLRLLRRVWDQRGYFRPTIYDCLTLQTCPALIPVPISSMPPVPTLDRPRISTPAPISEKLQLSTLVMELIS